MPELNSSRNSKSTILREEIVSVSMVEMNLETELATQYQGPIILNIRFKRINIIKALIKFHWGVFSGWRKLGVSIPLFFDNERLESII